MSAKDFERFLCKTMALLSRQLGAEPGSLLFGEIETASQPPGAYTISIELDYNHVFYLALPKKWEQNWLMRTTVDVVAAQLRRFGGNPERDGKWFLKQDLLVPHDEKSLANEYLILLYQYILRKFDDELGINFDAINALSMRPYEGDRAKGNLYFLPGLTQKENKWLQKRLYVALRSPYPVLSLENIKHIRKLLAGLGSREDNGLVFVKDPNSNHYVCRGYLDQGYKNAGPYRIEIRGPAKWLLYKGQEILFSIESERPKLWTDPLETAIKTLNIEFSLPQKKETDAHNLLEEFMKQGHGTSVIFINRDPLAGKWIDLLVERKRSISIEELDIRKGIVSGSLLALSRMDGAFIVDVSNWSIISISTIVDGVACVDGDLARGARHNSLTTALANLISKNQGVRAVAVIISEDGDITAIRAADLITRLKKPHWI